MSFKLMVNTKQMHNKEECLEYTPAIKNNNKWPSYIKELTLDSLADYILKGHSIVPAVLKEGKKLNGNNFISQQIFFVDFDNSEKKKGAKEKTKLEDKYYVIPYDIFAICNKYDIEPMLVYNTLSSRDDWLKFRFVFCFDTEITDKNLRNQVMNKLIQIFTKHGRCITDTSCSDISRIFYPAKDIIYKKSCILSLDKFLAKDTDIVRDNSKSKDIVPQVQNFNQDNNTLIQDIINRDAKKYREHLTEELKKYNLTLKDIQKYIDEDDISYYKAIRKIPFHLLLGLPLGKTFSCIFHKDDKPSAIINQMDDGTFLYKCFSDQCFSHEKANAIDFFEIITILLNENFNNVKRFIKKALDIEIKSKWQREQFINIQEDRMYLSMEDKFIEEYPILYKYLRQKRLYVLLGFYMDYASMNLFPYRYSNGGKRMFFIGTREASRILISRRNKGCQQYAVVKKLNTLCRLGLIKKLQEEDIHEKILETAKSLKRKDENRQDFLCLPEYNDELLKAAENIVLQEEKLLLRQRNSTYEQISRLYDVDTAKEIYTQNTNKLDKKAKRKQNKFNTFKDKLQTIVIREIESKGWTFEEELKAKLVGYKASYKSNLFEQIMPSIQKELNINKYRANKELRKSRQLILPKTVKYQSFILLRD